MSNEAMDKLDKIKTCVTGIEMKPHVKYIRYLLTKRYLPRHIRTELQRLALSSPHEANTTTYYLAVVDPLIKKYKLQSIYNDYKSRMMQTSNGRYTKNVLNFAVDICGQEDKDLEVRFLKFIKELEVDTLWLREVYIHYGSSASIPKDENGNTIIKTTSARKDVEKILCHPKRYVIDKLVLEGMSTDKIVDHCKNRHNIQLSKHDVAFYKKTVFSFRTNTIEDKIKALEKEKECLEEVIKNIKDIDDNEMSQGDRINIISQSEKRIEELGTNIRDLNKYYTDYAYQAAVDNKNDIMAAFQDIFARAYVRYCELDKYKDRDVVDPMYKVARIIATVHDKVVAINENNGYGATERHSQGVMMDLYKRRTEEINAEERVRANRELEQISKEMDIAGVEPITENVSVDDIAGIEELGVSFDVKDAVEEE